MEEIYILPDGSSVDISDYSESQRLSFLVKNPKAKKQKGAVKGATTAPDQIKAQKKTTVLPSETGLSGSRRLRLATEADLELQQKKGLMPPPSSQPRVPTEDYNYLYDLVKNKPKPSTIETGKVKLPGQRVSSKIKGKIGGSEDEITNFVENFRDNPVTGEIGLDNQFKIQKAKERIQLTDSELEHPYMYYSSVNQEQPDDFIKKNYNDKELEKLGINTQDFDGFLNKKGYKADYLDKEAKGLFQGEGRGLSGYDIGLAKELARKKLLTMYMEDMQQRDFTKQDLNQDIEIASGFRKEKDIKKNELFDQKGMTSYMEKNFPIITQTLKDRDKENAKIYQESKKGGTDFFSWETPSKIGKAGWNAIADRVAQLSATVYETIGMSATAEGVRMLDEENKLVRPDDRGVSYVSGKTINYNGTKYIVDSKGEIYDADAKIRVTDLFDDNIHKKLIEESKYGSSDWIFSTQGAAVQTSGVMADMLLQAAVTRGVGELGSIATETRVALIGAGRASKFTPLLNDTSQLLRKVPLDRGVGYSMIAQGALGYSQGYEETLKAARDNGINDAQAFKLANAAAQRMAVLYSTTGVINPQVGVAENVFGSKNIIKKAIEQYTKTGEKGFVNYIDDIIKTTPRNLVEFAEEGGKEVIQENIQQVGEIGINKMTNRDAGKKIMNDVMSGDDFMNTSILSFISSGLISKMKMPSFYSGDQAMDDLRSLSTLAKNKKEFIKSIDDLVVNKVFTKEQADNLKTDVEIYSNNINKVPKNISPDIVMPVVRELDKITKLENEKKTLDKAFHEDIDEKIDDTTDKIKKIFYADKLKTKNEQVLRAIKKGVVKNTKMLNFTSTEELRNYLQTEMNMSKEDATYMARQGGFMLDETALRKFSKDPSTIVKGQKILFVNEAVASTLGSTEVGRHEFLHGLISETIKDSPEAQQLLGKSLAKELMKMKDLADLEQKGETPLPNSFVKRFGQYVKKYQEHIAQAKAQLEIGSISEEEYNSKVDTYLGNQWEEVLTLYSDAISSGQVKYDEGTFVKLKDTIRRVLQYLGLKDIEFKTGKDVYNFIKDYNKSMESGNWGKAMKKVGDKGAFIDIESLRKETKSTKTDTKEEKSVDLKPEVKFSLAERKSSEDIKKDVNKQYDKEKWSVGSTRGRDENPAIERVLYNILGEYDYIIKAKAKTLNFSNTPGYSDLDMISETYIQLMPHIRNFNKEFFQKREEYKKQLESEGLDPNSKEFKDKVEEQDLKGYKGKSGIVKENDDLNAWINSQLVNKMKAAMKTGNVSEEKFTEDIEGEMFKESRISDGFGGDESYLEDEADSIFETENEFEVEQDKLAVLLSDPVFSFVDEKGEPVQIETIPFGASYVTEVSDPTIAANKKLKTETDPAKITELQKELKDLERGLELQDKKDITPEEKEELKRLKSFKSYDLSTGMMVNTFKALSVQDTPAKIITDEVAREILRSPNIETLEYRNFKEKLSTLSKTMARRITFKNGPEIESFMYNQWKLLYDVINHPVDPVTGQSSYASKKLPPRLKEFDETGNIRKIGDINRVKFLQSYYGIEEATRIIRTYGGENAEQELKQFDDVELSEVTGKNLWHTAYFDRRTALMELFGDVMVLQEARRLIRNPEFLDRVADRNVNLYNSLKDETTRTQVLNDMAKGKSSFVKFSLAESAEGKDFKQRFKKLTNTKEYIEFQDKLKKQTLYHSGSESLNRTFNEDKIKALWFYVNDDTESDFGDGVMYEAKVEDLKNSIIIPDINDVGNFHNILKKKYPKSFQQIKDNNEGDFVGDLREIIKTDQADEILSDWIKWASVKDNLNWDIGFEDIYYNGEIIDGLPVVVFGYMDDKNIIKIQDNKPNVVKFSLAEEENGKLSHFLKGLPFTKQWVVARDIDRALNNTRINAGKKETFNVPDRSNLSDESTAYFIISKAAEGFNDFEFLVKENADRPLTKGVLENIDIKYDKAKNVLEFNNNIEESMNKIIEQNTGVEASETFSPETAKNIGKNIGKHKIFLPPEDEDFLGLLYTIASAKGEEGEKQIEFLKTALVDPYNNAMLNLMRARQVMYKDWTDLINKKHKGISKILKKDSGYGGYLNDQAVRVYLWRRAGYEIPGLDKKDVFNLQEIVRKNPELRKFAEDVSLLSKQANGYVEPGHNWGFGSVVGDINNIISKSNRQKYLEHWNSNVEKAFSKDNLSKIEAIYGTAYVKALKDILYRMKTGSNRSQGSSDALLDWINGSTAVTMWANMRSAVLQTLGAVNYINTSDNNVVKAGLAMLNVPQYVKDFNTIWNSDYLKDRRSGLTNDVAEAELAQIMNDPRNKSISDKFKAANYWILKNGYAPTRFADSFAIAFGGAGFYRNRLNTYLKQGMDEQEAIKKTERDFYEISEVSQQSADVSKISMNQASVKGRILLSFMNTPFQYSRLIKKSFVDLVKGRGSVPNNIAKIVYYSTVQNIFFNAMQNALFSMIWDDEDEQKNAKFDVAKVRTINGALDTLVRGMGLKGVLLSAVKNTLIKWYEKSGDPKGYGDVLLELTNVSPSLGIKARALVKSYKAIEYNMPEIKYKGFSIDNTHAIEALTSITSAATNLPVDRLYMKIQNIGNALDSQYTALQRVAFILGYNKWNLGLEKKSNVKMNSSGGLKIPELKTGELKTPELKTP